MKVSEYLKNSKANGYFILDSHQEAMNEQDIHHQYSDSDYIGYAYNTHQYDQLKPGAFFLYRRPGKLSSDGKFHIYGGGIIESITRIDNDGNVVANVSHAFRLVNSINQGDEKIENYKWLTREKPGPGWKGFWINYGMNRILEDDYFFLISDAECEIISEEATRADEEYEELALSDTNEFVVNRRDDSIPSGSKTKPSETVRHIQKPIKINYDELQKKKTTIGRLGELVVLEYEKKRLKDEGLPYEVIHASKEIGDGLGYDIISFDNKGKEIHIEVKTTRTANVDGFYMTRREIEESHNPGFQYKIYRLYNFNEENCSSDLIIYDGCLSEENFIFTPSSYIVKKK